MTHMQGGYQADHGDKMLHGLAYVAFQELLAPGAPEGMRNYWTSDFIDLPDEASGTMPSTVWKLKTQHAPWYAGETISVGIGQGAVTAGSARKRQGAWPAGLPL